MTGTAGRWRPAGVAALAGGVLLLAAFVLLGLKVDRRPAALDAELAGALRDEYREPLGAVAAAISVPLGPVTAAVAGLVLLVLTARAWRDGRRERASVLLRALLIGAACRALSLVKPLFDRHRPRVYPDLSYPSGHVTSVACTAFVVVLLCALLARHTLRWVIPLCVVAVLVIAAARVVLTVHWLTDTIGAVLGVTGLGLVLSVLFGLIPVAAPPARRPAPPVPGR